MPFLVFKEDEHLPKKVEDISVADDAGINFEVVDKLPVDQTLREGWVQHYKVQGAVTVDAFQVVV